MRRRRILIWTHPPVWSSPMDLGDISDETLLDAWRDGDANAGAQLFLRHHGAVARFFMQKLGRDCDDLVQGTFLALLESLPRFRGEASFRTFLFAIARKKLCRHIRDHGRKGPTFDSSKESLAAIDTSPSYRLVQDERKLLLLRALHTLPLDTQIMLELRYWEGLRIKEIALIMDLSEPATKLRIHRGRARLKEELRNQAAPARVNTETLKKRFIT